MDPGALDPDGGLPISAYAKLEFEQFSFFIQTLTLLLGRKAKPGDNVDVHLGASKSISRNHAKIHYHFHASAWEIEVLGKNGAFVNERYVGAGETFPLHNEDKLQIAETPFTFLLPEGAAPPIDPAALAQADFDPLLSMPVETIMPSHTMNMEYMSDMLHPTTPLAPHDLMLDMHMEIPQLDDSLLLPPDQVALPLPPPELPQALPPVQSQLDPVQPTPKKKPRKRAEKRLKEAAKPLQYIQPETAQPTFEGLSALLHADSAMQTQAAGQAFVPSEPMQTNVTSGDLGAIQQTTTPNEGVAALPDTAKPKKPRKKYTRKPKPDLATLPIVAAPDALQTTAPVPVPVPVPVSTMQTQMNEHTPMDLSADQVNLSGYPAGVNQDAFLQTVPNAQSMNMVDDSHIDHALLRLVPAHDDDLDGPGQQASIITQNGRTPAEQQAYNEALARQQAIEEEGLVLPPEETDPEVIASFQRPTASYATLIYNAIVSHDHKKMTLAQIYNWICIHHPYYRYVVNGWQNSIRHNLSLNKAFMKVARTETEPGKGAFWAIDPDQEMLFENGVYKKKPPKPVVPPLSSRGNPIIMKDGKLALNPNFFVGPIQGKAEEAVKLLQEAIQKQLGENTTTEKAAQIAQALALALATQLKQADAGAAKAKSSSPEPNDKSDKAAPAKTTSEETGKAGKVDQDKDQNQTDKIDNADKTKPAQPKTNGTETSKQASEKPKPKPQPAVSRPAAASVRPPPVKNTGRLLNGHPVAMPVSGPSVDERQRQAALHKAALEKAAQEKAALAGTATVASQQPVSDPSQSPRTSASPAPSATLPTGTVAARSASPALAKQPDASNEMKSGLQPVKAQPKPVSSVPVPGRPPYQALPGRPVQVAPQQNGRPAQVASTLQGAQTPLPGRPVQGPSTLKHAATALPVARSGARSGADLSTPVIVQSTSPLPNRLRSASPVKKTAPSKAQVERAQSPVRPMKRAADEQPVGSAATKTART